MILQKRSLSSNHITQENHVGKYIFTPCYIINKKRYTNNTFDLISEFLSKGLLLSIQILRFYLNTIVIVYQNSFHIFYRSLTRACDFVILVRTMIWILRQT